MADMQMPMLTVPDNAMWFNWQGHDSREYGIVMTSIPQITKPCQKYETITNDYTDGDINIATGFNSYQISFDIAFIGTGSGSEATSSPYEFNRLMMEFFYTVRFDHGSGLPQIMSQWHNFLVLSSNLSAILEQTYGHQKGFGYDAILTSEINFEKFYKYYTATLTFKVQPVKHKVQYFAYPEHTLTRDGSRGGEMTISSGDTWTCDYVSGDASHSFMLNRQPMIGIRLGQGEDLGWLSTNDYLVIFSSMAWTGTDLKNVPKRKLCTERPFCFNTQKIASLISPTLSVYTYYLMIKPETNEYKIFDYSSYGINNYRVIDISSALQTDLSLVYSTLTETIIEPDGYILCHSEDTLNYNNFSIPLVGGTPSSTKRDMLMFAVLKDGEIQEQQIGNYLYYFLSEGVL